MGFCIKSVCVRPGVTRHEAVEASEERPCRGTVSCTSLELGGLELRFLFLCFMFYDSGKPVREELGEWCSGAASRQSREQGRCEAPGARR